MEARRAVLLRFADCELDLERFELRCGGVPQALEPQAFDVLAYLVAHNDRVVTKGELLDNVWGDRFVSESALSTRIKQARRAVGDDGRQQAVIQTVHGRGFRLVATVEEVAGAAPEPPRVGSLGRGLRRPASSFVGRDEDLAALSALLRERRLITLCGPGGVGKSRLATELASTVRDRWPEPPRMLDLAELPTDADLVGALAASAGVRDQAGEDILERLVDVYADRRLLLLVDNCEHLADQVRAIVRALIESGDGITVVATSRSPLHIDGEQVWPVDPLATHAEEGCRPPAVQLFLDRAAGLARPEWIEQLDQAAVQRLCERIDGIPLGIELAASRVRHVGLDALTADLDAPASEGAGGHGERHGSLEEVLAWSFDRLEAADQQLFEACAAFAGRFHAPAAAVVHGGHGPVTDALARLVDQSMLTVESDGGRVHYRVLSPLRDLGRRRAAEDGSLPVLVGRHARWAVDELVELDRSLRGPSAALAMGAFRQLLPELHSARGALADGGDVDGLSELCRAGFWFGQEQSRTDVLAWGRPILTDPAAPADAVAGAHVALADAAWQRSDLVAAREHAEAALAAAQGAAAAGTAALVRAEVCQLEGDHRGAVALASAISAHAEQADDPLLATVAEVVGALSCGALGRTEDAQQHGAVAAEIAATCGSPLAAAWAAYAEGECRLETDPDAAIAHLERAWSLGRAVGSRILVGVAGLSVVSVRARRDGAAAPLAEFAEVIDHWSKAGLAMHQWATIRNLVQLLAARGDDEAAACLYGGVVDAGRGGVLAGAEADRLTDAVTRVRDRIGPTRFTRLAAEGAAWSDAELVARARAACIDTT